MELRSEVSLLSNLVRGKFNPYVLYVLSVTCCGSYACMRWDVSVRMLEFLVMSR